jgi:hypothetical protein
MLGGPRSLSPLFKNEIVIAAKDFKLAPDSGIADVKTTCAFNILNRNGVNLDLTAAPAI